jgi:ABC-type sugar transport system permease subunit
MSSRRPISSTIALPGSKRRLFRKTKHLYLYLAPTFLILAIFCYYPPLSALYHSFFDWDGFRQSQFVGLANFQQIFQDPELQKGVTNLIELTLASLVTGMTMPLIVAELIFNIRGSRLSYLYRLLFVVPIVVPSIVTILLWQFIFDPNVGVLDSLIGVFHHSNTPIAWLGDPSYALYALMLVGFPWISGVNVLIYLAGLQAIPESVQDSARIDGAISFRRVLTIDLPLIIGQIKLLLVLGIIYGVQAFGLQLVLTQGGPGYATMVPGYSMYEDAFQNGQFGYGCAIGVALFLVILAFTYLNMRFIRSSVEYEAA